MNPLNLQPQTLVEDAIHVYQTDLDQHDAMLYRWYLSDDEKARADRFHFEKHRKRYTVGRGILRLLLASYLQVPAEAVQFAYTDHDKPYLPDFPTFQFNVTHSEQLALFGFTQTDRLGLDVEWVRVIDDFDSIARHQFAEDEAQTFLALPLSKKPRAFFNCWTRKEAFIKAIGEGLSRPLDTFTVSFLPHEPAQFHTIQGEDVSQWELYHLDVAPNAVGAIAIDKPHQQVHHYFLGK